MPTVATEYRTDFDVPEEIPRDDGVTLSCPVYDTTGSVVEATSGTFELVDVAGNVQVTGSVVTSATYTATYELTPSDLADLEHGFRYRVRWELMVSSQTVRAENTAGIVRQAFPNPVTDNDLTALHSELLSLIQGTGDSDLSRWTRAGYRHCVRWMARQGNRPAAVLDPSQLKELVTYWSLEVLFRDMGTGLQDSHWGELAHEYREMRSAAQKEISFEYDADQDGAADNDRRAGHAVTVLSDTGTDRFGRPLYGGWR